MSSLYSYHVSHFSFWLFFFLRFQAIIIRILIRVSHCNEQVINKCVRFSTRNGSLLFLAGAGTVFLLLIQSFILFCQQETLKREKHQQFSLHSFPFKSNSKNIIYVVFSLFCTCRERWGRIDEWDEKCGLVSLI